MENRTPAQQQMTEAPQMTEAEKDLRIRELERKVAVMEQEKRQRRKAMLVIGGVLAIVSLVVAVLVCSLFFFIFSQDKESPQIAEELLQSMLDGDTRQAFDLLYPDTVDWEELEAVLTDRRAFWYAHGGQDSFTLRRVSMSVNANPASSRYESQFVVRSGEARFSLQMVRIVQGESAGVVSFRLS